MYAASSFAIIVMRLGTKTINANERLIKNSTNEAQETI
jgi:hypothetical protein